VFDAGVGVGFQCIVFLAASGLSVVARFGHSALAGISGAGSMLDSSIERVVVILPRSEEAAQNVCEPPPPFASLVCRLSFSLEKAQLKVGSCCCC